MKVAVIDGQGGGIGKLIIETIRSKIGPETEIMALGTNSMATSAMLRAGANEGATGENAIIYNSSRVDIILGPIGLMAANSMLGELTPNMVTAIAESNAKKILIPFNKCNIIVSGVKDEPLQYHIECAVKILREMLDK